MQPNQLASTGTTRAWRLWPRNGALSGRWRAAIGLAATASMLALSVGARAAPTPFQLGAGLHPGDHYRIIFLTTNTVGGFSTAISVYNTFVTTDAGLGTGLPATTWKAIASTSAVDAVNNIACTPGCATDPIFLVDGTEVAVSTSDLLDGAILHAVNVTESDTTSTAGSRAFTGSTISGTGVASHQLGTNPLEFGFADASDNTWISAGTMTSDASAHIYAISGDLVVPEPEPEPLALLAIGGIGLALARRTRRGQPLAA